MEVWSSLSTSGQLSHKEKWTYCAKLLAKLGLKQIIWWLWEFGIVYTGFFAVHTGPFVTCVYECNQHGDTDIKKLSYRNSCPENRPYGNCSESLDPGTKAFTLFFPVT